MTPMSVFASPCSAPKGIIEKSPQKSLRCHLSLLCFVWRPFYTEALHGWLLCAIQMDGICTSSSRSSILSATQCEVLERETRQPSSDYVPLIFLDWILRLCNGTISCFQHKWLDQTGLSSGFGCRMDEDHIGPSSRISQKVQSLYKQQMSRQIWWKSVPDESNQKADNKCETTSSKSLCKTTWKPKRP